MVEVTPIDCWGVTTHKAWDDSGLFNEFDAPNTHDPRDVLIEHRIYAINVYRTGKSEEVTFRSTLDRNMGFGLICM